MPTKLLSEYSTKQLQQELEKRRFEQENFEQRPGLLPSPVILTDLQDICEEYLDFIMDENNYDNNDFKQYIYEEVMRTLYGNSIFDWINKQLS